MNRLTLSTLPSVSWRRLIVPFVLGAALLWSCWPALMEMAGRWSSDPRYSHGYLVPVFAIGLLWRRRALIPSADGGANWWGVAAIVAGEVLKLVGARYYVSWSEGLSLLFSLAGLAVLAGGLPALRWAWPAILFLFFMIPLPYQLEVAVGYPLQRAATIASTYILQTLGLTAVAEGNVIQLDHAKIGVVEACNGLGMIFMFSAFTTGAVLLLKRNPIEKLVILLSTVPIALAANILRITATSLLHEAFGERVAHVVYHDVAGWLMMPVAVGALWLELVVLSYLVIERESRSITTFAFFPEAVTGNSGRAAGYAAGGRVRRS